MIYYCADDYGLNRFSSARIQACIEEGALNKVSVFPNFDPVELDALRKNKEILFSLHLNLVEGKCMAEGLRLIADEDGNLKYTFGGLLLLSLLRRKEFSKEVYREIGAQVRYYKSILPSDLPFCIDSHQHTYMIPAIFKALLQVLREEEIRAEYLRIPAEPILPFLAKPSLYLTYTPINLIKQWLLKLLWLVNKKELKKFPVPTAYFFGILFSGKMDEKRVKKVLPGFLRLAEKRGRDLEILFHPGYLQKEEADFEEKNIPFQGFYLSPNRRTEFESCMKMGGMS